MRFAVLTLAFGLAACGGLRGSSAPPASKPTPVAVDAAAVTAAAVAVAPTSFVRSTAESQATRQVDVRDGLSKTQSMRILTDALGQRFTVDVVDPRAGFAMTAWQAAIRDGVPDLRYRTRVTARFLGDDWRRLQVRDEANWARGEEWDIGYDAVQLDSVATDLRGKLSRKP